MANFAAPTSYGTNESRPLTVFEYVSGDGAEERDETPFTGKHWVYERRSRPTYYAIWDTPQNQFEVLELIRGRYQPMVPDANGRSWIPEMEVSIGIWHGEYHGYTTDWLRVWDRNGIMLPTATERMEKMQHRVEDERQRAEAEKQRADTETQRAEKLAARLRELGVDPDSV